MNNTNRLIIDVPGYLNIDMQIIGKVTVLCGDSGSGKTLLFKHIMASRNVSFPGKYSNIDLNKVTYWSDVCHINYNDTNKLIMIDRYPLFKRADPNIDKFIIESKNKFIIASHVVVPGTVQSDYYTVTYDMDKCKYIFKKYDW